MNSKVFWRAVRILFGLIVAAGVSTSAQDRPRVHFGGVVNDYPVSSNPTAGPWELRGPWSLDLGPNSGTANFSAALTMEFSDIAASASGGAGTDARKQHTHHITMKGATLILNPPQS